MTQECFRRLQKKFKFDNKNNHLFSWRSFISLKLKRGIQTGFTMNDLSFFILVS